MSWYPRRPQLSDLGEQFQALLPLPTMTRPGRLAATRSPMWAVATKAISVSTTLTSEIGRIQYVLSPVVMAIRTWHFLTITRRLIWWSSAWARRPPDAVRGGLICTRQRVSRRCRAGTSRLVESCRRARWRACRSFSLHSRPMGARSRLLEFGVGTMTSTYYPCSTTPGQGSDSAASQRD